jgi:hypothetical protein
MTVIRLYNIRKYNTTYIVINPGLEQRALSQSQMVRRAISNSYPGLYLYQETREVCV